MPVNQVMADTSVRITGTIVNCFGVGFQPDALTFTLYDLATAAIINSRNDVALTPIINYVSETGDMVHVLARADQVLLSATADEETHIIRYKWTYNNAADAGMAEIEFRVCRDKTPTT
jgi:hypothetical protein